MTDTHDEDVRLVRSAVETIDDEGSISTRPCTTFSDALDRILATIDRQSRLLAAYEAEHEAAGELRWRTYLTRMPPIDPDWSQDLSRFNRTHDHAEQVRKEGL